ncbi:PEP-CTERM sorting domain-containing protein [Oleiharenicola lentus]|uniref:PEP-CTERM sorting domain-containing protein n=1 Tax=Oleiharenicola lentus TaxID=2508720 RepID=UPI003F6713C1
MKTRYILTTLAAIFSSVAAFAQIAYYDMSSLSGTTTSVAFSTKNANIQTASNITRGSGLAANSGSGVYASTSWSFGSSSINPLTSTDYVTFTLTAASGYTISLSSFSLKVSGSGTAPNTISAYSSTNGFASLSNQLGSNQTYTATVAASPNTLTFTPGSPATGTALEIRVYGFGTIGPAGGAPANGGSIRFDDFTVNGAVNLTAVPEPSTYAAIFGVVALAGVVVRRRNQAKYNVAR